jgi:hypothetical protein
MNTKSEDYSLKYILAQVHTPAYDPTDKVMEQILRKTRKNRISRPFVIAAALCAAFMLLGAARVFGWVTFDFSGNTGNAFPIPAPTQTPENEKSIAATEEIEAFIDAAELGEARITFDENGSGTAAIGAMRGKSLDEIQSLLEKSAVRLALPQYVPEGYVLTDSTVEFYLTPASLEAALSASYEKDGTRFASYRLPDGYQSNIASVRLFYENDKGELLHYEAMLTQEISETNSLGMGAPDTATAETIHTEGFEKGILIYDKAKLNETSYSCYLYKAIPAQNVISPLSIDQKGSEAHTGEEPLSAVVYSLEAETLDRNAVIEVINSIKYV